MTTPNQRALITLRSQLGCVGQRLILLSGFLGGAGLYATGTEADPDQLVRTHGNREIEACAQALADALKAYQEATRSKSPAQRGDPLATLADLIGRDLAFAGGAPR